MGMLKGVPHAEISLRALARNLASLRARTRAQLLVPVKANAYGHGAPEVARQLERLGVPGFGVATADVALELRGAGISADILIFGPVYEGLEALIAQGVALSVVDARSAEAVVRAAGSVPGARVHLKTDTGMGRLGEPLAATLKTAERLSRARGVTLEGLWTHLAAADEPDSSFTQVQLARFSDTLAALGRAGITVPLKHAANSAALFAHPASHFDLVRPGIAVYGYHASPFIAALAPELTPVMTLSAPVTFVKRVAAGTPISYGGLWRAPRDTTVATVRFGYADGYPRGLSATPHARVRLQGRLCPIVGRVCMDQLMVDVGDLTVTVGERAVLFGPEGPTAEDLAGGVGTISYELLTQLGRRVARSYVDAVDAP